MVAFHYVADMSLMMRLPWQWPLHSNGALNILQIWASGGRTREPILMKFGTHQEVRTARTVTWSNIKIFKIQNGGRSLLVNIRNAITRLPMDRLWRNLGGHIPSCSRHVRHDAVCGCHGNGRCPVTAHWTFCSYGRLEAERVNQFWWNLVHNSILGPQWQSRDQKFKMADGRCWKIFEMP